MAEKGKKLSLHDKWRIDSEEFVPKVVKPARKRRKKADKAK